MTPARGDRGGDPARACRAQAAIDFVLGHLNVELAIAFEVFPGGKFSDGALQAIENAKPVIFKEGWLDRVFAKETCSSR